MHLWHCVFLPLGSEQEQPPPLLPQRQSGSITCLERAL